MGQSERQCILRVGLSAPLVCSSSLPAALCMQQQHEQHAFVVRVGVPSAGGLQSSSFCVRCSAPHHTCASLAFRSAPVVNWLRPACNAHEWLTCTQLRPAPHSRLSCTPAVPLGWTGESLAARRNPFHNLVRPGTDDAGLAGPSIQRGLFTADVAPQHSALHLEVGPQLTQHSCTSLLCDKLQHVTAL